MQWVLFTSAMLKSCSLCAIGMFLNFAELSDTQDKLHRYVKLSHEALCYAFHAVLKTTDTQSYDHTGIEFYMLLFQPNSHQGMFLSLPLDY